jgi:hypothetical protein
LWSAGKRADFVPVNSQVRLTLVSNLPHKACSQL